MKNKRNKLILILAAGLALSPATRAYACSCESDSQIKPDAPLPPVDASKAVKADPPVDAKKSPGE